MDQQLDSESYWNRSTSRGFSFDDDEVNLGAPGVASSAGSNILNDYDTISEASFDNSAASGALNLSVKSLLTEESLKTFLQEQTLDDRIISKGLAAEEELKLLRRQVQSTFYNPSPEVTAHKMLLGKTAPLEVFKSLHEKEQLLDAVLRCSGGDAVVGVLLFLKKTLNRHNFYKILEQRPKALRQYISYLTQRHSEDATQLLQHFGKHQEAALLQFKSAIACHDKQTRYLKLRQCCGNTAALTFYQQIFNATMQLHELIDKEHNTLDNKVHINSTPVEVLYACCRKYNNWSDQKLPNNISPGMVVAQQQISPAQYEWTALNERALAQAYADLEGIFESVPTWPLTKKKFNVSFGLEQAVMRLYELQAPTSVLYMFLTKMPNTTEKLQLAQRVKCVKAVIDALVGLKDANQLMQLKESLVERTEEQIYCEKALEGLQSKRWTTDNINIKLKL